MDSSSFGVSGEEVVSEIYSKRGYKIIGRNVKIIGYKQLGEIDLITRKGRELVFVEVKARSDERFMPIVETVTWRKKQRLLRAVKGFLNNHIEYKDFKVRLDVALITPALDGKTYSASIIEDAIQDN